MYEEKFIDKSNKIPLQPVIFNLQLQFQVEVAFLVIIFNTQEIRT